MDNFFYYYNVFSYENLIYESDFIFDKSLKFARKIKENFIFQKFKNVKISLNFSNC